MQSMRLVNIALVLAAAALVGQIVALLVVLH